MKKFKILITGGAGNIGGSLSKALVAEGHFVTIFDNFLTGSISKLPSNNFKNWELIKGNINNKKDLYKLNKKKYDYIFHYAALVGVKRTLQNPIEVLQDIDGIKNILNFAIKKKPIRIFYSSSSEIYGEPVTLPQNEISTPLNSRLPYAIVKNIGESYMKAYSKKFNIKYTIFRFFNTYGPLQSTDFVISKFINSAKKNKDIEINGRGYQTRTFLYIDDNINFTLFCLKKNIFINSILNLGSDKEIKIVDLAKKIKKLLKSKSKIVFKKPLKEGDMSRRKPSIKLMRKFYKRKFTSLENGILKTASNEVL